MEWQAVFGVLGGADHFAGASQPTAVNGVLPTVMERYFFHLFEPDQKLRDVEGVLMIDVADARREAVAAIRDMVAAEIREDGHCRLANRSITIADEGDRVLDVVKFVIAVSVEGEP